MTEQLLPPEVTKDLDDVLIAHLKARIQVLEEALDNSQSLLVMVHELGSGDGGGITSLDWDNEGLTRMTSTQISENRAALQQDKAND